MSKESSQLEHIVEELNGSLKVGTKFFKKNNLIKIKQQDICLELYCNQINAVGGKCLEHYQKNI